MLHLQSISIYQFKNYREAGFRFPGQITGICGPNGVGKTNLLDAIYYCCFGKSYFARNDAQLLYPGAAGFRLEARFEYGGREETLTCILRENGRKEISLNQELYSRLSDHVGRYPCIIIVPDDVEMISGGSELRRRFADSLFSQIDPGYLNQLVRYNRLLQQRNAALRQHAGDQASAPALLDIYDQQLEEPARYLFEQRRAYFSQLIPLMQEGYERIAGQLEPLEIRYESQLLTRDYRQLLRENRGRDLALQRSSAGIHRDDLALLFRGELFRNLASQGQRKSLLFAMKLAAFGMLAEKKGFPPLLLLDDIFEKLDAGRMSNLLDQVCRQNQGQVFLTDTHADRMQEQLEEPGRSYQIIRI